MQINNRNISFWHFLFKLINFSRIKIGFLIPTLYAKIVLTLLECPYGSNLKICGKVYFRPNGKNTITLGNNITLTARFLTNTVGITNPVMLECIDKGKIKIGNNTGLSSVIISARTNINIGDNVNIGGNVRIFDHDFHPLEYQQRRHDRDRNYDHVKTAEIIIGDDVFIGTNAMILKGVHIGARSIIGAGSVVTCKNIPPDSVVTGNPAKIISRNSAC